MIKFLRGALLAFLVLAFTATASTDPQPAMPAPAEPAEPASTSTADHSGKYAFVSTEMSWPITHMVAPKDDALACAQCHQPSAGVGRLDKVPGIYLPGRHGNKLLDTAGWGLAGLTLLGVLGHGAGRIFASRKAKPHQGEGK